MTSPYFEDLFDTNCVVSYLCFPGFSLYPSRGIKPEKFALGFLVSDRLLGTVGGATHETRNGRALHGWRLVLDRHSGSRTGVLRTNSKAVGSSPRRPVNERMLEDGKKTDFKSKLKPISTHLRIIHSLFPINNYSTMLLSIINGINNEETLLGAGCCCVLV